MALNNYLEHLEELPLELQRNLVLMRDLDANSLNLMDTIEKETRNFLNVSKDLSDPERQNILKEISERFTEALKQGEDKVVLATQTYNIADQCIRRLDQDLLKFETDELVNFKPIKVSIVDSNSKNADSTVNSTTKDSSNTGSKKRKKTSNRDSESTRSGRNKEKLTNLPVNEELFESLTDMPIDPNEPTYCYCNQVSFGEMVGCDDETCAREWFHYQCVGLKTQPKGKWYCNDCIAKKRSSRR